MHKYLNAVRDLSDLIDSMDTQAEAKLVKALENTQVALLTAALLTIKPRKVRVRKSKLVDGLTQEEMDVLRESRNKITVIKKVRERLQREGKDYGLKIAKNIVENYMQTLELPHVPPTILNESYTPEYR